MQKVYIVGVGPGAPDYVTPRARAAIEAAQVVLGWDLDFVPVQSLLGGKSILRQDVSNYKEAARQAAERVRASGETLAVLRIGEPCISSGLPGLLRLFDGMDVEIVPGISSIQLAAALARINIDDSAIVSFHDYGDPEQEKQFMIQAFQSGRHIILLPSPDLTVENAASFLLEHAVPPTTPSLIASNLTLPNEEVTHTTLGQMSGRSCAWLSILVVANPATPSVEEAYFVWQRWRERMLSGQAG